MTATGTSAAGTAAAEADPTRTLHWSILISAVRCTLTYVVLPFIAPFIGLAPGVGPYIGIPLACVGIVANGYSIKRYWGSDHRWKWPVSAINVGLIVLLTILLILDITQVLS